MLYILKSISILVLAIAFFNSTSKLLIARYIPTSHQATEVFYPGEIKLCCQLYVYMWHRMMAWRKPLEKKSSSRPGVIFHLSTQFFSYHMIVIGFMYSVTITDNEWSNIEGTDSFFLLFKKVYLQLLIRGNIHILKLPSRK